MINFISNPGQGKYMTDRVPGSKSSMELDSTRLNVSLFATGLPQGRVVNTSPGAFNYMHSKENHELVKSKLGFSTEPPKTQIYSVFNGQNFGEWIEIQATGRFMNRDVGPNLGFVSGLAVSLHDEPSVALKQLPTLSMFLSDLNYAGEVLVGVDEHFQISTFCMGHFQPIFACYAEMLKSRLEDFFMFAGGLDVAPPTTYDSVVLANLVSQFPYPGNLASGKKIIAPASAEKHLWRLVAGQAEPVLVTTHGVSVPHAYKRLKQTIDNIRRYDPDVQFRTDVGYGFSLLFRPEATKWEKSQ